METVGSVYMVVSGMPQRNGDRHVTEIANMAVDIRSAVNGATMTRRCGDVTIQLRIGIHTGRSVYCPTSVFEKTSATSQKT